MQHDIAIWGWQWCIFCLHMKKSVSNTCSSFSMDIFLKPDRMLALILLRFVHSDLLLLFSHSPAYIQLPLSICVDFLPCFLLVFWKKQNIINDDSGVCVYKFHHILLTSLSDHRPRKGNDIVRERQTLTGSKPAFEKTSWPLFLSTDV